MIYKAKLLLFGEYTVIQGSPALAIPFGGFSGSWQPGNGAQSQKDLSVFAAFLAADPELKELLDTDAFLRFLQQGWFFDSSIPTGYGLGSSGAVCAAVYDRFARMPLPGTSPADLPELKRILAKMESFFHGSSSGADPLVVYADRPLLFKNQEIRIQSLPDLPVGWQFFLLDTGMPRQTGPLVERYLKQCQDPEYLEKIKTRLIPEVESAIQSLLNGNAATLFERFKTIGRIQGDLLQDMIPENDRPLWETGLAARDWSVKLCGAGGGGFLLVLSRNKAFETEYTGNRIAIQLP